MPDLQTFVLAARKNLIRETEEQLVQIYGLKSSGEFLPEGEVPALTRGELSKEAVETRRRLKQLVKDEQEAGITPIKAIKKLTKEVAFTHLNRLVSLKLLEGRKLVRGVINNWHNSNAFLFFLADQEQEQRLFEQGSQPTDDRDEGPNDRAYRHFLLWQYSRLAEEVKVLFDADNLASRLFPRPQILRSLANDLNSDDLKSYWAPGNEETLGWVYQFFNAEEKSEAFARVFKKKQKFQKEDIPAATQIFTPRWIVEYLVQNSLGRLWVAMHTDSALIVQMPYLVPMPAGSPAATMKPVREIRLLDPATGTMHFGLVAFDWLVKMYREELVNAGKPGWPAEPSVNSDEDIPGSILANNLFGIDIDLRAVQLSALTLYLRAKQTNSNAKLTESRLACADIAIFRGQHLDKIAKELQFPDTVTRHLFEQFCESVDEAAQMGSLVRLEKHFQSMGAERLRAVIDEYVANKATLGEDESYFGNETNKGLRLLDIMTRRYDVLFTNPPYMSNRNMNPTMSEFMKNNYKKSKGDLYAAFIERCFEMLADGGRMAMLTQQSFMFISSYDGLRELLLQNTSIENMAHTGPRAFAEVTGEKVNTTAFVLRREAVGNMGKKAVAIYFRLVKESNAQRKQVAFEEAIDTLRCGETDSRVYQYQQANFSVIPGSPWVYWLNAGFRQLFEKMPKVGDVAEPRAGMHGGDRFRFARQWWEVGESRIARFCHDRDDAFRSGRKWVPYMKGGSFKKWYGNQDWVIAFDHAHFRILAECGNKLPSRDYYFRSGITYSAVSSSAFSARISPGGFIFDAGGSSLFPEQLNLCLACLNSPIANVALRILNPTVNIQAGDIARIPMPKTVSRSTDDLVQKAIEIAKCDSYEDETTYDFVMPPAWSSGIPALLNRFESLQAIESDIEDEVYRLYEISISGRQMVEDLLLESAETAESEPEDETVEDLADSNDEKNACSTVDKVARQWVSYAVGIALGRFSPGVDSGLGSGSFPKETSDRLRVLSAQDGMMVLERGHPNDLAQRVWDILSVAQGDEEAEKIVRLAVGSDSGLRDALEEYFLGAFFKDHIRQYRKRPIYWLLQSPKRTFSVYLFHERATSNTLSTLQGNHYLGGKIHSMETELTDLLGRAARAEGSEKTSLTKQVRVIAETLEDLKAFDAYLGAANQVPITGADGQPKTARWEPELDDGIFLNAAPLHELTPAWKKADGKLDLKMAWKDLEAGKYDWSKTAMRYWPGRVLKACRDNKSFAIAHGLK